jgi:hypothetical protein
MKLGTKSHLITAYSALFTVAVGVLLYASFRREPARESEALAQESAKPARLAKATADSTLALQ